MLHGYLIQEWFVQSLAVPCVSVTELGQVIAIVLVDEISIAGSNTDVLKKAEESLMMRLKMKNLGGLSWFLGIQFKCENNGIDMSQSKFVENILERFNMSHWKPKAVPCELGAKRSQYTVNESEFENVNLYREIVGSLIYLKTCTRPDFYVVTYLYQHLHRRVCGNFILHYGLWFTFKALTHPVCMKIFRSKFPNLVGKKLIRFNGSIWLGFTNKLPTLKALRHLDAVSLHQRSQNHLSDLLCSCVGGISIRVSGFNRLPCPSYREQSPNPRTFFHFSKVYPSCAPVLPRCLQDNQQHFGWILVCSNARAHS